MSEQVKEFTDKRGRVRVIRPKKKDEPPAVVTEAPAAAAAPESKPEAKPKAKKPAAKPPKQKEETPPMAEKKSTNQVLHAVAGFAIAAAVVAAIVITSRKLKAAGITSVAQLRVVQDDTASITGRAAVRD